MFSMFMSRRNCANYLKKCIGMLGMQPKIRFASCNRQKFKGCKKPKPSKLGPYESCRTVTICEPIEEKCMKRYLMPTNPECLPFCDNADLRYDLTMYQPHDCRKRSYQQTWDECGPVVKRRKRCYAVPPKFERRVHKRVGNAMTCSMDSSCRIVKLTASKCPKITMPGCKDVKSPPNCRYSRGPSNCRRRQTRYPSYSECERDPTTKPRPVECNCLQTVPMCLIWEEFRKRHGAVKK